MFDGLEELDNLVWDKNDEDSEKALKQMPHKSVCRYVEGLAEAKFGKRATLVPLLVAGGFNTLYRIRLDGTSPDIMVRFPCPTLIQFPDEKTGQEAATAAFVAKEMGLLIPRLHFYGLESPVGAYVIMDHVEFCQSVSARLARPTEDSSEPHVLDPDIAESALDAIWGRVAHCYLRICRLNFPCIGSLVETIPGIYQIAGRPVTHNMTDMVRLANIPRSVLPPEGTTYDTENFRLWGDDFRAGNILLTSSDEIAALVDWEFTYAGPAQFSLDPPWWLLIETPEMWLTGMDDWWDTYNRRLKTWLTAMRKAEADMTEPSSTPAPLSAYMEQSWKTGRFFLSYAARKSWAFDAVYWKYLDERFFGERETGITQDDLWRTRVHLLSEQERAAMEPFVDTKMDETGARRIVDWDPTEAKHIFAQLLFDYHQHRRGRVFPRQINTASVLKNRTFEGMV